MTQIISRKGTFNSAHRLVDDSRDLGDVHGHTFHYTLNFTYSDVKPVGCVIDFKDIDSLACSFLDRYLDHAYITNPSDRKINRAMAGHHFKLWEMVPLSNENDFINPTAENIAREMFYCISKLINKTAVALRDIELSELHGCSVHCSSLTTTEIAIYDKSTLTEKIQRWININKVRFDDYTSK